MYRPWIPLHEQLNPVLLSRTAPRPQYKQLQSALDLPDWLYGPAVEAGSLLEPFKPEPETIQVHYHDLYCLMRADLVIVDLSQPSHGDQGYWCLAARLGGVPVIGVTDRYTVAPSLLSCLDTLIVPQGLDHIVRTVLMYLTPTSTEPLPEPADAHETAASPLQGTV